MRKRVERYPAGHSDVTEGQPDSDFAGAGEMGACRLTRAVAEKRRQSG